ncbi:hypothetical protein ACEWB5_25525, partial [Citrobacter koseri]
PYTADDVLELAKIALAPCKDGNAMTLIDFLVKELSKGAGWPDGKDFWVEPPIGRTCIFQ